MLFVTKYKNARFTPQVIQNYFISNTALIKSKNKLFFNKLKHKNVMPFKFLIRTLKNVYTRTFSSSIVQKNLLKERKKEKINQKIENLKEINNQLYAYLLSPLPGKKLNLIYLALYNNNRQL